MAKAIPGWGRELFAFAPESLFAFSPESCSSSPRKAFRDHPGIRVRLGPESACTGRRRFPAGVEDGIDLKRRARDDDWPVHKILCGPANPPVGMAISSAEPSVPVLKKEGESGVRKRYQQKQCAKIGRGVSRGRIEVCLCIIQENNGVVR